MMLAITPLAAQTSSPVNGTWSGNWTPKGGVPDAITVELRQDNSGALTGKFLNPAQMEFTKASFNAKTGAISIEATDKKAARNYKLTGRVEGNELRGSLVAGDQTGDLRLVKWTFFGR
jgi:hypothetical protein